MNIKTKKALVALLSVLIVAFATALNAFAYITDTTNSVVNTFVIEGGEDPTPPDPPQPPNPPQPPSTPDEPTPDQPTPDQTPEDAVLEITVNKIINNLGNKTISPKGFEFKLTDTDTDKSFIAATDENGIAVFKIKFTANDIGKTYHFSLREIKGDIPGVVYSTQIYNFSVYVSLGSDNRITTSCVMADAPANESFTFSFTNIYDAPPVPGDSSSLLFYVCMSLISLGGLILLVYTRRNIV